MTQSKEEEEQSAIHDADRTLLQELGVTAASTAEVERHVISQVEKVSGKATKEGVHQLGEKINNAYPFAEERICLIRRLQALDRELEAVDLSLQAVQEGGTDSGKGPHDRVEKVEQEVQGQSEEQEHRVETNGILLRKALARERLKSLKIKRRHVQARLAELDSLQVGEAATVQRPGNEGSCNNGDKYALASSRGASSRHGDSGYLLEDDEFDAALDAAASSGMVETDRDRLIRTGVLTPFHRLHGFERRVKRGPEGDSSPVLDVEERMRQSAASTVAAMQAASQGRRHIKVLDVSEAPHLEPVAREFQRLRRPLVKPAPSSSEKVGLKISRSKRRRPLPSKQWLKESHEDDEVQAMNQEQLLSDSDNKPTEIIEEGSEGEAKGEDVLLEGGLRMPSRIWDRLFEYQQTGVKWMWELHCQRAGGIIGDEMGLGKTVQVASFLAALHHSGMYKPSLVVCPVTLLRQWHRELRKWHPAFEVEILHDSVDASTSRGNENEDWEEDRQVLEDMEVSEGHEGAFSKGVARTMAKTRQITARVSANPNGLLLTTYERLRLSSTIILPHLWGYCILDEGHRIRNPDAETTLVCKQVRTVHRIIMTGAPIQNHLRELWSLFDFVFPGKLGTLPVFHTQFALPISLGGYSNASSIQVSTAYKCAVVLRDLILPYLLRRMKADVQAHLPNKTESALFCTLTKEQRSLYQAFISSSEVEQIFDGARNALYGIDILRKICNHPDLLEREQAANHQDYGNPARSAKLQVALQVLGLWHQQGHRVLLFAQTQQMLDILERALVAAGYCYRRMDGATPVKQRMALMDEFNGNKEVFCFLLTTRVGGLGTNLTGANRVIIFDPDWNPSTDIQARERAWRIGQLREVTVYRLITRGTIEEKVYHRQIYKQMLSNRILRDPSQRRMFKARDLRDLFTLGDDAVSQSETMSMFEPLVGSLDIAGASALPHADLSSRRSKKKQRSRNKHVVDDSSGAAVGLMKGEAHQEENPSTLQKGNQDEEDAHILKSLFEANGIHSALDHDSILAMGDGECAVVDIEASRAAQRAAEALRQSRMLRQQQSVEFPTWTGRHGAAGDPRFGATVNRRLLPSSVPSETCTRHSQQHAGSGGRPGLHAGVTAGRAMASSELLARLRLHQRRALTDGVASHAHTAAPQITGSDSAQVQKRVEEGALGGEEPHEMDALHENVCKFLQLGGGSVASSAVAQHFAELLSDADLTRFRSVLKAVAVMSKLPGADEPRWVLRSEFRTPINSLQV